MAETLWVARDADGYLAIFMAKPKVRGALGWCTPGHHVAVLSEQLFPDLKPGECRKGVLTLSAKEGKDAVES